MLLLCERRHRVVARKGGRADKRSLDDLEDGPALREEQNGTLLEDRGIVVTDNLLVYGLSLSTKNLLQFNLKGPIRSQHSLEDLGLRLIELDVDALGRGDVLLATVSSTAVVPHMHGEDVAREPIGVEVHRDRELRACETQAFSTLLDRIACGVADMAHGLVREHVCGAEGGNVTAKTTKGHDGLLVGHFENV